MDGASAVHSAGSVGGDPSYLPSTEERQEQQHEQGEDQEQEQGQEQDQG